MEDVTGGVILGSRQFVVSARAHYIANQEPDRDLPALKQLQEPPQLSHLEAAVERIVTNDAKLLRNLKIYFIQKYSGATLKTIGKRYGLGESGVSQVCRRLNKRKTDEADLKNAMSRIDKEIKLSKV